jgi:hypothetical protein
MTGARRIRHVPAVYVGTPTSVTTWVQRPLLHLIEGPLRVAAPAYPRCPWTGCPSPVTSSPPSAPRQVAASGWCSPTSTGGPLPREAGVEGRLDGPEGQELVRRGVARARAEGEQSRVPGLLIPWPRPNHTSWGQGSDGDWPLGIGPGGAGQIESRATDNAKIRQGVACFQFWPGEALPSWHDQGSIPTRPFECLDRLAGVSARILPHGSSRSAR